MAIAGEWHILDDGSGHADDIEQLFQAVWRMQAKGHPIELPLEGTAYAKGRAMLMPSGKIFIVLPDGM